MLQYLKCSLEPNFSPKQGGAEIFFSWPVAGLTNWGHVQDFQAGAPLNVICLGLSATPWNGSGYDQPSCHCVANSYSLNTPNVSTTFNANESYSKIFGDFNPIHINPSPILHLSLLLATTSHHGACPGVSYFKFTGIMPVHGRAIDVYIYFYFSFLYTNNQRTNHFI